MVQGFYEIDSILDSLIPPFPEVARQAEEIMVSRAGSGTSRMIWDEELRDVVLYELRNAVTAEPPREPVGYGVTLVLMGVPEHLKDFAGMGIVIQGEKFYVKQRHFGNRGLYEVSPRVFKLILAEFNPPDLPEEAPYEHRALLEEYGWTPHLYSVVELTLPQGFIHHPGEYPTALYWAHRNGLSKAAGLDMAAYLGRGVKAYLYALEEPPPSFFQVSESRAVVVTCDGEIIGAFMDTSCSFNDACSLDGCSFEEGCM